MVMSPRYSIQILAFGLFLSACKTSNTTVSTTTTKASETAIVELGDHRYSVEDFVNSYQKNKFLVDSVQGLDIHEYVDLYTNLKLKVLDAISEGRDTTSDYKEEITTFRQQLARPYLSNKETVEKLKREAYDRLQQELHVSHILTSLPQDASPEDTLKAYQATVALIERIKEGGNFAEMAKRFSADKSSSVNGGDLGYFTAFQMVYPFENAAYQLKVGEVSQPVRSKFGYHIIKLHNKRPAQGKFQVSHIMIRNDAKTPHDSKAKIQEAYKALQGGTPWKEIVQRYSDDLQSRRSAGLLPVFGIGEMVPEFELATLGLKTPGEYSTPIHTKYGWHIIRLERKIPILSYDELEPQLQQKVVTDSRGRLLEAEFADKLAKEYTVVTNQEALNELLKQADASLLTKPWSFIGNASIATKNQTLLTIQNKPSTTEQFFDFITIAKGEKLPAESHPETVLHRYYKEFVQKQLIAYEQTQLERKHPEFKQLMQEIEEGVLLSQVMEKNVWGKSLTDSLGQQAFYEANKELFKMDERADATLIYAPDAPTLEKLKTIVAKRPFQLEVRAPEVLFNTNESALTREIKDQLLTVRAILVKNPRYIVEVASFSDKSEQKTVSAARLKNVVDYFVNSGIPITRIIEKNHSTFRPLVPIERNRRVSFQFYSNSSSDLSEAYSKNIGKKVTVMDGYFTKGVAELREFKWQTGEQQLEKGDQLHWLSIRKIEPERTKTFKEARGSVINAYQKKLEENWLNSLKNRYPVKINSEEVRKLVDKQ